MSGTSRPWTQQESAYLYRTAPKAGIAWCAGQLGRTEAECEARLAQLAGSAKPRRTSGKGRKPEPKPAPVPAESGEKSRTGPGRHRANLPDGCVSVKEAAEIAGTTGSCILSRIKRGKLKAYQTSGSVWAIPREEAEACAREAKVVQERRTKPKPGPEAGTAPEKVCIELPSVPPAESKVVEIELPRAKAGPDPEPHAKPMAPLAKPADPEPEALKPCVSGGAALDGMSRLDILRAVARDAMGEGTKQ